MTELAAAPVAWYRIRMVWLVLAIPTCTVLGCMLTIYLALSRPDYLVRDAAVPADDTVVGAASSRDPTVE